MAVSWPTFFFAPRALPMDCANFHDFRQLTPKTYWTTKFEIQRWSPASINSIEFSYGTEEVEHRCGKMAQKSRVGAQKMRTLRLCNHVPLDH